MKRLVLSTLGCALALGAIPSAHAQTPAAPTPELAPFPAPGPAAEAPAPPAPAPTPDPAAPPDTLRANPEQSTPHHRHSKALVPAPVPTPAVTADTLPAPEEPGLPAASTPLFSLWVGATDTLVATPGFDAFATDDQLPLFHAEAAWGFGNLRGTQLALTASLDLGGTSASDRGAATNLDELRLGLGPELRVPLFDRLYLLGRIAPEAVRLSTELHEFDGALLTDRSWTFGLDAALGAALRIADITTGPGARSLGLFLRLEAGYSWTASKDLQLEAGSGSPLRTAALPLGELALRGVSLNAAIGLGY